MSKKTKICLTVLGGVLILAIVGLMIASNIKTNEIEGFRKLKSNEELTEFISQNDYRDYSARETFVNIATLPISLFSGNRYYYTGGGRYYATNQVKSAIVYDEVYDMGMVTEEAAFAEEDMIMEPVSGMASNDAVKKADAGLGLEAGKDYSTTNIQVVDVDEADRIKTDGNFIYTINNECVNVVDASNANNLKDVKKIEAPGDDCVPVDLFINGDKLVVIYSTINYENNTLVCVYDKTKEFELAKQYAYQYSYVTSRMIGDRVIVITNGWTYNDFEPIYNINGTNYDIDYKNIFVNKKYYENGFSYIASMNLSDLDDVNVYGVTLNTQQVYVSEDNIYLIKEYYDSQNEEDINIGCIFGFKGLFGVDGMYDYGDYRERTKILKLSLDKNNEIDVKAVKSVEGRIINQFSFDEKDGYLRIALDMLGDDQNESGVTILDKNLNVVEHIEGIAKGENIYAARFAGDRLYLVTYRNMDPLFVIDLKNNKAKVLGELKIPGYSTYLHPYDNDHIIGIGVDTKESVHYDSFGRVVSTSVRTLGLKMALFDVSNVTEPKEISKVTIGDDYTTSNILTNHKALLFSKEKELLAIPVRQNRSYGDKEISFSGETIAEITDAYNYLTTNYGVSDSGFAVYKINLEEGIKLKGYIYHENQNNYERSKYYNYVDVPVRGLFIKDNLFTVSNDYIKVNRLSDLGLISKFDLK